VLTLLVIPLLYYVWLNRHGQAGGPARRAQAGMSMNSD
jgi:hypothetical protein